jgi:hypothetical protein
VLVIANSYRITIGIHDDSTSASTNCISSKQTNKTKQNTFDRQLLKCTCRKTSFGDAVCFATYVEVLHPGSQVPRVSAGQNKGHLLLFGGPLSGFLKHPGHCVQQSPGWIDWQITQGIGEPELHQGMVPIYILSGAGRAGMIYHDFASAADEKRYPTTCSGHLLHWGFH